MELLYIWVKEYKCFKNQEFNFNPKHKFKFDLENFILKYWQNDGCIEGFFSNELYRGSENQHQENSEKGLISNLTVIVGNNGAGKTTLLEMLYSKFVSGKLENQLDVITCFKNNEKIKIYFNSSRKLCIETKIMNENLFEIEESSKLKKDSTDIARYEIKSRHRKDDHFYKYELNKNTNFIYYSNTFDDKYCKNLEPDAIDDISTIGLLRRKNINEGESYKISLGKDTIINFFQDDFYRQIQFIYNFQESSNYIDFSLPEFAKVAFCNTDKVMERIYKRLYSSYGELLNHDQRKKLIQDRIEDYEKKHARNNLNKIDEYPRLKLLSLLMNIKDIMDNFINNRYPINEPLVDNKKEINIVGINILQGIFTSFFYEWIVCNKAKNDLYNNMINNIDNYIYKGIGLKSNINDLFECIKKCLIKILEYCEMNSEEISIYIESINKFQEWMKSNPLEEIDLDLHCDNFKLRVKNNSNLGMENLGEFYKVYKETAKYFNYLDFSWPVSTGEYNMIGLFARFYSLIIDKESYLYKSLSEKAELSENIHLKQDVIILIDEADMTFHPEWQQKYLKKLLDFLKKAYEKCNIQLIITTHSPIMLSDIPNDNVIFLYKEKGKNSIVKDLEVKTFASNIYNLYKEGFFLEGNNFGMLGDFATSQIEKVQKTILEYSVKINGIEEILINIQNNAKENGKEINKDELEKIRLGELATIRDEAKEKLKDCKKIINFIGEKFIRDTIEEQYDYVYKTLELKKEKVNSIKKVDDIKNSFDQLSDEDQNELIKYIIRARKK